MRHLIVNLRAAVLAISLVLCAGTAFADDADKKAKFDWKDCKADVEKYCKLAKGSDAVWTCLEDYDSKLTRSCDATHTRYELTFGNKK